MNFERVCVRVADKTVTSIQWKMSVPKKSKTYHFHNECKIEYLFVMVKDKRCLICNASVSLPKKKGNLERHYNGLHSNEHDADFPHKSEFVNLSSKNLNQN
jgi:hypothetical protein